MIYQSLFPGQFCKNSQKVSTVLLFSKMAFPSQLSKVHFCQDATWTNLSGNYREIAEKEIVNIQPKPESYNILSELFISAAKKSIPCGFCKEYIPCWDKEYKNFFKQYQENENSLIAQQLIITIDEKQKME